MYQQFAPIGIDVNKTKQQRQNTTKTITTTTVLSLFGLVFTTRNRKIQKGDKNAGFNRTSQTCTKHLIKISDCFNLHVYTYKKSNMKTKSASP